MELRKKWTGGKSRKFEVTSGLSVGLDDGFFQNPEGHTGLGLFVLVEESREAPRAASRVDSEESQSCRAGHGIWALGILGA